MLCRWWWWCWFDGQAEPHLMPHSPIHVLSTALALCRIHRVLAAQHGLNELIGQSSERCKKFIDVSCIYYIFSVKNLYLYTRYLSPFQDIPAKYSTIGYLVLCISAAAAAVTNETFSLTKSLISFPIFTEPLISERQFQLLFSTTHLFLRFFHYIVNAVPYLCPLIFPLIILIHLPLRGITSILCRWQR